VNFSKYALMFISLERIFLCVIVLAVIIVFKNYTFAIRAGKVGIYPFATSALPSQTVFARHPLCCGSR